MTFARLLLEIRRRAAALPDDSKRPESIERIARDILADLPDGDQSARVLAAFLGVGEGDKFDAALLDQMTPELVLRLDMVASEFLEVGRANDAALALRSALIRRVH